jgi:hypothetical protein
MPSDSNPRPRGRPFCFDNHLPAFAILQTWALPRGPCTVSFLGMDIINLAPLQSPGNSDKLDQHDHEDDESSSDRSVA